MNLIVFLFSMSFMSFVVLAMSFGLSFMSFVVLAMIFHFLLSENNYTVLRS